jgi:phosphoglycolate phosphatase
MKFRCVIFDLDGTLVDTIDDITTAANHALTKHSFPSQTRETYLQLVGNGWRNLITLSLPEDARDEKTVDAVSADGITYYEAHLVVYTKPYPGIRELTAELRGKRIKTAVLSNKPDSLTQMIIAALFPRDTFDIIQGDRPRIPRKPDPASTWDILTELGFSPRDAIFMGDSEVDMQTAHNADCHALGVSWGFRDRATLEAAGADRIIDEPGELLELLNIRY